MFGIGRCANFVAMSGSNQHDRVALVSVYNSQLTGELLNTNVNAMVFKETQERFGQAQEVLQTVALYMEPAELIQMVCNHPEEIIKLQKGIRDLTAQHFLPPTRDQTKMENRFRGLENVLANARKGPAAPGTGEDIREELAMMTRDAHRSGKEVCCLMVQLANVLTLAVRAAPAAPQPPEDRGQKFPVSPDFSVGSNSFQRLDRLTPDGHKAQGCQLSRRTAKDAVCIQPPQGSSLRPDFATRLGGRSVRAGTGISFDTTPGISV